MAREWNGAGPGGESGERVEIRRGTEKVVEARDGEGRTGESARTGMEGQRVAAMRPCQSD